MRCTGSVVLRVKTDGVALVPSRKTAYSKMLDDEAERNKDVIRAGTRADDGEMAATTFINLGIEIEEDQ